MREPGMTVVHQHHLRLMWMEPKQANVGDAQVKAASQTRGTLDTVE